jgi:hypothetical protein
MLYLLLKVITIEMEDKFWEMGFLGDSDPITLLNTVVYVFGLHFALRGRDEHRRLRRSQLTIGTTHDGRRYLEYREVSMYMAYIKDFISMLTSPTHNGYMFIKCANVNCK